MLRVSLSPLPIIEELFSDLWKWLKEAVSICFSSTTVGSRRWEIFSAHWVCTTKVYRMKVNSWTCKNFSRRFFNISLVSAVVRSLRTTWMEQNYVRTLPCLYCAKIYPRPSLLNASLNKNTHYRTFQNIIIKKDIIIEISDNNTIY